MMFFSLLLVTFLLAFIVAFIVVRLFDKPVGLILQRIIGDEISAAWNKYIKFAAFVVAISGGVRIYELERYITPQSAPRTPDGEAVPLMLNAERWTLEIYRTVIETLQSVAWMYLVVFVVALIAYVIVRGFELRHKKSTSVGE
jgi:ABC-type transport system involved in multi-copper enzyme maturation permease subunit